jgi:hypothetical protein
MITDLHDAILALYPDAVFVKGNTVEELKAYDINENEIAFDLDAVTSWVDPYAYQKERAAEYPSIQDQLDMQYWDGVNGTTVWADTIAAIKAKYPKGGA